MTRDPSTFYSPVLDERYLATCGKCNACRHACPVHAITVTVTGVEVDRDACFGVISRRGGECFDCMLACKHNVLKLRPFTKDGNEAKEESK